MKSVQYSVIIPVYNSAEIVGETIERTVAFFEAREEPFELILVNDGSRDESWAVLAGKAQRHPCVIAVDLDRNYGQHTAIFCGIQLAQGEYLINLDDDLQNPPEELEHLIAKVEAGHDVVFGRYLTKQHPPLRRIGSRVVAELDRVLFGRPPGLIVTNFRIYHREIADQIRGFRAPFPYLRGLLLMHARNPADVLVDHQERLVGTSGYTAGVIFKTLLRIFFNYALAAPYRVLTPGVALTLLGVLSLTIPLLRWQAGGPLPRATGVLISAGAVLQVVGLATLSLGVVAWYMSRSTQDRVRRMGYMIREIIRRHDITE